MQSPNRNEFTNEPSLARRVLAIAVSLVLPLFLSTTSRAELEAQRVATGLTLPLYVCAPPGDTARIFVAEQGGKIKIIDLATGTVNAVPFLDISSESGHGQGTGILGMTFDPNYASNGHFYVAYTTDGDGTFNNGVSHIARFTVTADPNLADPASEVTVLTADQPEPDHNFDWIGFSPRPGDEGNLYICSGDGGGSDDDSTGHLLPNGNAQSTQTLLGKILRIHIEDNGSYTIPMDNPFFGSPTEKQEVFCYGLRNPFRASFDPVNFHMLIGDVGEHEREELDLQSATNPGGGENYGWRIREGLIQNPTYPNDPVPPNAIDPILDYDHETTGICIIGGYVYHGTMASELTGLYIFGDCFGPRSVGDIKGRVFTLSYDNGAVSDFQNITTQLFPTKVGGYDLGPLTSLGEDASGEIYLTDTNGSVFTIKGTPVPPTPTPTPSPTPSASPTPTPSATPSPTPSATPTPTPTPTATPTPTPTATPTPSPSPTPFFDVQVGNISTRSNVGTGDDVLIGGFIVTGTEPKEVIARAIGPSLMVNGKLADPILELHDSAGVKIATNDNWQNATNKQAIINSGLAPSDDMESAVLRTLDPGVYTTIVRGVGGTTGLALVEIYDLDRTVDSKLGNISTRGMVGTGDDVLIGGVIIQGDVESNLLVRAIGPSLADDGVSGTLQDPVLELYDANGDLVTSNDDWKGTQQAEIEATGLAPTRDAESAILKALSPDNYTAIVRGKNDSTGIALVEVYDVGP